MTFTRHPGLYWNLFLFGTILIGILALKSVTAENIVNLTIDSQKVHRPYMVGGDIQYNWTITNIGDHIVTNVNLSVELRNMNTKDDAINTTCKITILQINKTALCWIGPIQIVDSGIYDLLIYSKSEDSVYINNLEATSPNYIFDHFIVFTLIEVITLVAVVMTFSTLWNAYLKGGSVKLSRPLWYQLTKKGNMTELKIPLIFQNDGPKSLSIDYLVIILRKGRTKLVLRWVTLDSSIATPFIVPPRGHAQKMITFETAQKDFEEGRWKVELTSRQDDSELRESLLNFETKLKLTKKKLEFDFWNKVYQEEIEAGFFSHLLYWFGERIPKGYKRLATNLIKRILRFFLKR